MRSNQQVTNVSSEKPVGTPETLRATTDGEELFNQWLAGLIDGDGCFLVSKQGYTRCELTLGIADEHTLRQIQNKLGGSVKLRSGVKAYRWYLTNKPGMLKLIGRVNGEIRNTIRLKQLEHLCSVLNIPVIQPGPLHARHGWFSGFFDAEGSIYMSHQGIERRPRLGLGVTNLLRVDVAPFETFFGGGVYYSPRGNGSYQWSIGSRTSILPMLDYFRHCPSRTSKKHRLLLVPSFYELKDLKAWQLDPLTQQPTKPWQYFLKKWTRAP